MKPHRHRKHRLLVASISFFSGLLLIVLPWKLGWGDTTNLSHILAPVAAPPTAERAAQSYLPTPFPGVEIPPEILICLEPVGERFDLLGTAQEKDKTFYLLGIYPDFSAANPFEVTDELISVDSQQGCDRLIDSRSVRQPLSTYMSLQAAQNLELQRFGRYSTLLGGVHHLQEQLGRLITEAQGNYLLSQEQVQALQALGIQIPNSYKIPRPDTFSSHDSSI